VALPLTTRHRTLERPATSPRVVSRELSVRRWGGSYLWIVLGLTAVAFLSRIYTTNSLVGEPTSDEYLYAVHARDLARDWSSGQSVSLDDLGVEGRSVAVESAALSFVVPWDPLTIGRTMQAFFNALCIPATFVLARQVGLARSAALVGALLLMAVPEFQELAWRFWTDSQATFLCLAYLSALVAFSRQPRVLSGVVGLICLTLLLLTKESAAVTFTPFLLLAASIPIGRRLTVSSRRYAIGGLALAALAFLGLGVVVARAPGDVSHNALLQRTFGAGPLIFRSLRDAIPRVPDYSEQLVTLIGPTQLGTGFLWATLIGFGWLIAQTVVAIVTTDRSRLEWWPVGWLVALAVWVPAMVTPWRDVGSLNLSDPWVAVAAGGLLVAVGTVDLYLRNARPNGWGLALLGLVVVAVLAERLVIAVTPKVSNAALTFRSLMPVVPLFAILAGGGLWAAAGSLALLSPTARSGRAVVSILGAVALVTIWSPLLRDRLSSQPLLGRVADRGADPDTPQGLRVEAMVEAQSWLQANLQPTDVILSGKGMVRHLAWYADLGVEGMDNLIDLGSQPRDAQQTRQYILDRVGPRGVSYVVDFNVDWTDPGGDASRQWRQTYETLASRPNLETAYLKRDKFGHPVFYVIRNHGYAAAPR
jgi:hypothetical protein